MRKSYFLFLQLCTAWAVFAIPPVNKNIKVDQFGYLPGATKIAVISNPVSGYNNTAPFTPGAMYELKRYSDEVTVYSAAITQWNNGATHTQSGDKLWWFDFSSFVTPGKYFVYDATNNVRSYEFEIDNCVYKNVLKSAFKMYYYQRCGEDKKAQYAGAGWADNKCHTNTLQDKDCRLYNNNNVSTSKDLSGGWHDAGDYNKYVNFAFEPVLDLLLAYEEKPSVWGDDFDIPESGNLLPDILDEVKVELDWLLRMQQSNGAVLSVVGVKNHATASPQSSDLAQRFYGPATTSATFSTAAMFALGAISFKNAGQTAYSNILQTAAINAWNWATANPGVKFNNSGIIAAGEQEVDAYNTLSRQIAAAAFLFALTGNTTYKSFFEANYNQIHLITWSYVYPFECAQQNVLLYYSGLAGASSGVANAIKNAYKNSVQTNNADNLPAYLNKTDGYRAYLQDNNYTWGSNTTKGRQGIIFTNMLRYSLDNTNNNNYFSAAAGYIHYFHGNNPNSFCYLTNMSNYGAENSITEIYHSWFKDGSPLWDKAGVSTYGPAPGYVSGGCNPGYSIDGCCPSSCGASNNLCNTSTLSPPLNQPIQKSYKDWNTEWPQNSWTITEPGIYTQASYIRLLAWFQNTPCATTTDVNYVGNNYYLNVYPNPAQKYIFIQTIYPTKVVICDLMGNIIIDNDLNNDNTRVDVSMLSHGMYLIYCSNMFNTTTIKFIKE